MKKYLFMLLFALGSSNLFSQTNVFHENFESPSNADSVTASNALYNFTINTRLHNTFAQCDSAIVSPSDTAWLTTNAFSTLGFSYVILNFAHICKIEIFDGAEVQISIGGGSWTNLTSLEYINSGNSQFVTSGNKFTSNAYPNDWYPTQNGEKPTQSWWKNEVFDISVKAGNKSNVRIRFALRDGNGNGANLNHGWYIDDIKVYGAISELTPPRITLKPPIIQDTVYTKGPFDIYAGVTDASGIDSVYLSYTVNSGSNIYMPMARVADSTYKGTIPSYQFDTKIDYNVIAKDSSASHNQGSSQNMWFYIQEPPTKITMKPPVVKDTVFNTGPFDIYAWITDGSGIDSTYLIYQLDGGADQYIPMHSVSDSTYLGTIPSYTYGKKITYQVHVIDSSFMHNHTVGPNIWFYTKKPPPTVIIGTGTASNGYPFYEVWGYSRSAAIYTGNEINMNGLINTLSWKVSTAFNANCPVKIYLRPITSSTFSSGDTWANLINGAQLVYDDTANFLTTGWYSFLLSTPYYYTSGNLLVLCENNIGGLGLTSYTYFNYTTTTGSNTHQYYYQDNTPPTGNGSIFTNRPNIKISFTETTYKNDASVKQILTPTGTILSGVNSPVSILIKNYGTDTLRKAIIEWELDGVLQTPYVWTGMVPEGISSTPINLGNVNVGVGPHSITAWTKLPNDSIDKNTYNDTSSVAFYACSSFLNGTYTIGPGGNYSNFAAALTALGNCGVSGPVIFNVISGIYNEQLNMPVINGISDTSSVTFQSASGKFSDVIVQFTANSTSNNFLVKLNGAKYLNFKNMTFQALGTTYATVVNYTNNSHHNTFTGNKFIGAITTTNTSTDLAVVYSPSGAISCDSVMTFDGNIIENGSYGFCIYGQGSLSNQLENKTIIKNNKLFNQYYRGIFLYYQNSPQLISNVISTNSVYTAYYAIQTYYCDNKLWILKNNITLTNGGTGIYIYYCDGTTGNEGLTANNVVSIGGLNTTYGIYDNYSSNQNIYYNSVNVYSNSTTANAIYLNGGTTYLNHKFKNNIFAYTGTNTSGRSFYVGTPTMVSYSDYNDLYSTGTNLGYWNANCSNLNAWKAASAKDSNSISANPAYFSPIDLHTFSSDIDAHAKPIPEITEDNEGNIRNTTTPDIGAYEYTIPAKTLSLVSIINPVSGCGLTNAENITIRLKNSWSSQVDTAQVYYQINNGNIVHEQMVYTILKDSSYNYTFATKGDLHVTNQDLYFNIKSWISVLGDTYLKDDTTNKTIASSHVPTILSVVGDTVAYKTPATLKANSTDSILWYSRPSGGLPLSSGHTYVTPKLLINTVYYAEAKVPGGKYAWNFTNSLEGWTPSSPCGSPVTWVFAADGGRGTAYAVNHTTSSSQVLTSPVIMVNGNSSVNLSYTHRYKTEADYDHGFVAYRKDGGPWIQFIPSIGSYNKIDTEVNEPLWSACSTSVSMPLYDGTMAYATHSGAINTAGASSLEIAFVFTTDGSGPDDGWYIDNVIIDADLGGCASSRSPVTAYVIGTPPCDVEVQEIISPSLSKSFTGTEIVKVRVKNTGLNPASNIPIHYKINNGSPVDDTIMGPLPSNDTLIFSFSQPLNALNYGNYQLQVYSDLICDNNEENDTSKVVIDYKPLTYCPSIPTTTGDEEIFSVTVNGKTNAYNCTTVAPGPGSILNRYSNFTTLPPLATLNQFVPIQFNVVEDECDAGTYYSNGIGIWIDLNRDGDFTDSDETMFKENTTTSGPRTVTGTITIPPGAMPGLTTMRIICAESYSGATLVPCLSYSYGETEDYTVRIAPQQAKDASVVSIIQPDVIENMGASVPVKVVVINYGSDTIKNSSNMTIAYSYNGGTPVSVTWNGGNIAPLTTDTLVLGNITKLPGNHTICAWTNLVADSNTFNDTICKLINGKCQFDVGIDLLTQPTSLMTAGSTTNVRVSIHNYGRTTITTMPVSYKESNGIPVTEIWTGNLAPDKSVTYIFPTSILIQPGANVLCVYTGLSNDEDHSNDTLCPTIHGGIPQTFVPYHTDMEGKSLIYTSGNVWEYGVPASSIINSAHSPTHAWKTNLDGIYANNADGYLYSPFFDFSTVDSAFFEFYHWYNTQANGDGCNIQFTLNSGLNWITLGYQNDPAATNWYNSVISGTQSWSGNSTGYVHSKYDLTTITDIMTSPIPVQFRFRFFSNASTNFDGWSIDDFAISAPKIPIDAGVTEILMPNAPTQTGTSVKVAVVIKNYGKTTVTNIPVKYIVSGGAIITGTYSGTLAPDDTAHYNFTVPFISPSGIYKVCAFTSLGGDTYKWNDTTCIHITSTPGTKDVGVWRLLSPEEPLSPGMPHTVTVTINNYGMSTETSIPLVCKLNNITIATGTWTGTLNPGYTADYTFSTQFTAPVSDFHLCIKTNLTGDVYQGNDELCRNFIDVGIDDYDFTTFELLQNQPNPGSNQTSIIFLIPSPETVSFELVDILGQVVMKKDISANAGKNQIDLDVANLHDGVYFYSVIYNDKKLTKRMLVAK